MSRKKYCLSVRRNLLGFVTVRYRMHPRSEVMDKTDTVGPPEIREMSFGEVNGGGRRSRPAREETVMI